jgi:hypothetical protein
MNNERIRGLLLRILSGISRAAAYAGAHDLAGLNDRPRRRRLIGYDAGGRLIIVRLAFNVHPEPRSVKLLSGESSKRRTYECYSDEYKVLTRLGPSSPTVSGRRDFEK